MNFPNPIAELLPEATLDRPASGWIHTTSVTGPYGITAAVKDFDEVMDWQEHRRELTQGYYRLIHPPRVQDFKNRLELRYPGFVCTLFCSGATGRKELSELLELSGSPLPLREEEGLPDTLSADAAHVLHLKVGGIEAGAVLLTDRALAAELHERNRRRGGSVSARNVDVLLGHCPLDLPDAEGVDRVSARLKEMEQADFIFFYPSGMGAVTAVLDLALRPGQSRMLVLGNVYRDTHLLLEEQAWAGRPVHCDFLDYDDLQGLEDRISDPEVCGVFLETVTNPLIEIPDLPAIAALCRSAEKPLLVDSTMAGPLNACPLALGATVVMHSTSKYLSGNNTHGGGVVLTSDPQWRDQLQAQQDRDRNRLSPLDLPPLEQGIQGYPARMERFNRNGEALAAMLREHPAVDRVYFANAGRPAWLKGLGSVVSCELKQPGLEKLARFFNAKLPGVIKAPSLGSDQTLFCPYVLLAYYDKSDAYLEACGLSKTLLRFAAGSEEDFSSVLGGIEEALDQLCFG
ncbi:MAG: PLP-dependent transferase [Kiritimatiellia bacterium]